MQNEYISDKELREKATQEIYQIVADELAQFIDEFKVEVRKPLKWNELSDEKKSYWYQRVSPVLALLPPKIGEARKEVIEFVDGNLSHWGRSARHYFNTYKWEKFKQALSGKGGENE